MQPLIQEKSLLHRKLYVAGSCNKKIGSLYSTEWNGGMERWNGTECCRECACTIKSSFRSASIVWQIRLSGLQKKQVFIFDLNSSSVSVQAERWLDGCGLSVLGDHSLVYSALYMQDYVDYHRQTQILDPGKFVSLWADNDLSAATSLKLMHYLISCPVGGQTKWLHQKCWLQS